MSRKFPANFPKISRKSPKNIYYVCYYRGEHYFENYAGFKNNTRATERVIQLIKRAEKRVKMKS